MRDRNLLALSRELIAVKSRQRNNSSSNPFKKFFLSTTHSTSSVWLSFSVLREILISNPNHKVNDERNSGTIDFRDKLTIETEPRGRP